MDFKTRKLRKEPKQRNYFSKTSFTEKIVKLSHPGEKKDSLKTHLSIHTLTIFGSIALLVFLVGGVFFLVKSLDFSAIVFSFGKTLQTEPTGRTNFLLVGTGGEGHEGASLTDTIMIASIDYDQKIVPMISIPRDLFVETDELGNMKINGVYAYAKNKWGESEGMYYLKDQISEMMGLPIQYYVKVNFAGFEKIVDSIGGVDIDVENAIYDPEYPKGETIYYETFKIDKGFQHINGATALKYARSRKSTSDYDRARRQQQLLYAIKDQALSMNVLTDPGKISALYSSVADSIDTNLTLTEIIELAKLSREFNKDDVFPIVLNEDPTSCGGLLYTPVREYFGGAAVSLPAGNSFKHIQDFVSTTFSNIKPISKAEKIQILNGTKTPGLAWEVFSALNRYCLNGSYYSNAANRDLETTTIYYQPDEEGNPPQALSIIGKLIPAPQVEGIPPEYLESEKRKDSVIVIELGKDYLDHQIENPFDSLKYTIPVAPVITETTPDPATTQDEQTEPTTPAETPPPSESPATSTESP